MKAIETTIQLSPPDAEAAARLRWPSKASASSPSPYGRPHVFIELGTEVATRLRNAIQAANDSPQERSALLSGDS